MRKFFTITVLSVLVSTALVAGQPTGGDFVISNSTIDNGGGVAKGGDFVLTGTIGQPDASTQRSAGNEYALAGGFWGRVSAIAELIFKDGFE